MSDWVLDICAGLGGFSEGFILDPNWEVVRVENNPLLKDVPNTQLLDVLEWIDWLPEMISKRGRPALILASPPCLEFSTARTWAQGRVPDPDMSIVEAIWDIIDFAKPPHWIVENVAGASPHFLVYFGRHKQKIGPFLFWGVFPHIIVPQGFKHSKAEQDVWSSDPLRANKKAKIPLEISNGILDGLASQTSLFQNWG